MTTVSIPRQLRSSNRDWLELCCLETATIPSVSPPSLPPEPETRNETLRMQRLARPNFARFRPLHDGASACGDIL
jgi:hypothetical protein